MTEPRVHDRAASLLDDGAESEAAMQRVWHRVKDAEPRAARRFPRPIAAAGAVAALALGVLLAWPSGPTPPLRLAAGTELRPSEAVASQLVLAFDDGSRVQLQAGSSLTPVRNEGEHIAFRLPAGRAHFDVVPGGPRTWEVQTPRFRVRVLGTSFSVEASDERSAVRVERGRVAVEDVQQGTVRTLGAGEEWIIEQDPPAPPPARTADESFESARNEPSEVATDERPEIAEERRPRSPTAATDVERAEAEVDVLTLVDEARRRGDT
ncbi:MAG: FecR family protein, partial [Myxococcota bacterium]